MEIVEESNKSSWKKVFPSFKVHSVWHGGKKGSGHNKNKIYNQIRLVTIDNKAYLEVQTQLKNITFLCDIKNYKQLRQHVWYTHKKENENIYYIRATNNKNLFHRLLYSKYQIIDHINRLGIDNREINLRETTSRENQLNCRLQKNNTSKFNGISFHKRDKKWRFRWQENNKQKCKWFKTKEKTIEFKLEHDKITGNRNGYSV